MEYDNSPGKAFKNVPGILAVLYCMGLILFSNDVLAWGHARGWGGHLDAAALFLGGFAIMLWYLIDIFRSKSPQWMAPLAFCLTFFLFGVKEGVLALSSHMGH